jgi:sec-independent protein translocase protein TatC
MASEPHVLTSGLFERLQRIRTAVLRLGLLWLGSSLLAFPFASHLLHFLVRPLGTKLVIYAPMEGLLGHVAVSCAAGFVLTAPFLLYTVNRMLRALGLAPTTALYGTVATGGLFQLGVSFCYGIILPVTLRFLLSFGGENIAAGISVSRYLSMTLGLSSICGVLFQLPLIVLLLHHLGLISRDFLTSNRRYAILLSAVLTAILTPTPDAFTMSALLLPLLALYEVSILLVRWAEHRARA